MAEEGKEAGAYIDAGAACWSFALRRAGPRAKMQDRICFAPEVRAAVFPPLLALSWTFTQVGSMGDFLASISADKVENMGNSGAVIPKIWQNGLAQAARSHTLSAPPAAGRHGWNRFPWLFAIS